MIATMALIVLFLLLVATLGVALLRRVGRSAELVPQEVRAEEPRRRGGPPPA